MGAWNTGNFDNDAAADLLAEQKATWIKSIENTLQYYQQPGVTPMEAEDEIMTYLEMIYRIAVHDLQPQNAIEAIVAPSILPERKHLEIWKKIILTKHIEHFGKAAHTSGRYETIKSTFDALIGLAQNHS